MAWKAFTPLGGNTVSIDAAKLLTRLALATVLCVLPAGAAGQPSAGAQDTRQPIRSPRQPDGPACLQWRWIGIKADPRASCPQPRQRGWSVQPLFHQPDPRQATAPFGLRNFCLYEHARNGGQLTLAELPGIVALGRDCLAVLPAAPPVLLQRALPELEQRTLRSAGMARTPPPATPRARLALLDTAPTSEDPAGNPNNLSPHGYTLASLARRLACSGNACVAQVTSQLALPRRRTAVLGNPGAPDPRGGEVGTIADLAQAIRREVVAWQQPGRPPVLLLNLSLGWNGRRFGGLEGDPSAASPSVQAVQAALVDAVCRGVTVMAAAGNRSWGPDPEVSRGPLLPAAWEARRAPAPVACAAALSPGAPPAPVAGRLASARPLVHAVGAVRAGGQTLGNSRLDGEPRLVAFGDHAAVAGRNGAPTAMLTGSSVSTLVVTASLAWVRYHLQALDAFSAVDRLYLSGIDRGRSAAFSPAGRQPVRQVDVGTAAAASCLECKRTGCPVPCTADAQTISPGGTTGSPPASPAAPAPGAAPSVLRDRVASAFGDVARRDRRSFGSASPPHRQFFDTSDTSETGPQPGSNPCTTCVFGPGGGAASAAFIEIDADFEGQITSAVLQAGAETYLLGDLQPGARMVVTGLPASSPDDLLLSFLVDGTSSATSLFFAPE